MVDDIKTENKVKKCMLYYDEIDFWVQSLVGYMDLSVAYELKICTHCNDNKTEDLYHIIMKCALNVEIQYELL